MLLLLRPRLLTFKNTLFKGNRSFNSWFRDGAIVLFSLFLVAFMYEGTIEICEKLSRSGAIPITHVFTALTTSLFLLLSLNSLIAALSTLFLSKDLEILFSSPITPTQFFIGKGSEIFFNSSWMLLIFGIPSIAGFLSFLSPSPLHTVELTLLIGILFIIPSFAAIGCISLLARIVPMEKTKPLLVLGFGAILIGAYGAAKILAESELDPHAFDVRKVTSLVEHLRVWWNPVVWIASLLEKDAPTGRIGFKIITASCSVIAASYFSFRTLYGKAYTEAKEGSPRHKRRIKRVSRFLLRGAPRTLVPYLTLAVKEYKLFLRDMIHAVQLILLLTLCLIYLYNFKILHGITGLPHGIRIWWGLLLVISNLLIGGVVIATVCTRFVFPSVSLEGQSFWILQKSPLSSYQLLRAKFWIWFIPLSLLTTIVIASGGFAVGAEPFTIAMSASSSLILCFGLTGLATGLGAHFANFTWEHPSQITASFGSLVYMMAACLLIALSMIPIGLVFVFRVVRALYPEVTTFTWFGGIGTLIMLLVALHYITVRWSLLVGAHALESLGER